MNLKQAKRLRRLVEAMDEAIILRTLHTRSKRRGQESTIEVFSGCLRGKYLAANKQLKGHNFNLVQFDKIVL
jgi:hypothetical protein